MDIKSTFKKRIAPELNHIYTIDPFILPGGGMDGGWFCREHAFHVFLLSNLFGWDSDIRRGDFVIYNQDYEVTITSLKSSSDHMWCRVGDILPLDLSLTLKKFNGLPQLRMPILKTGKNGSYNVLYMNKDINPDSLPDGTIVFIEREVVSITPIELLNDPYKLIHPPNKSDTMNWDSLYGPEIYAGITLHCFRLATRDSKAMRGRLSPSDAPKWITEAYPNALEILKDLLS